MKRLRPDSYEASLSREQREELHVLLLEPGLSLGVVRGGAPAWRGGQWDGSKPSIQTLSEIATRLRTEQRLVEVEANAKLMEAVHRKLKATGSNVAEEVLDGVISLVGQEVIKKTLSGEDPKNRTAAARLLLKRADQRRFDRRMSFLEKQVEKGKEVLGDTKLSAEEQRERLKRIFGMG